MSNTTKEVLPGRRGPFAVAGWEDETETGYVVDANGESVSIIIDIDAAHALARVLNSHLAVVEALKAMPRPSVRGTIDEFGARVLAWQPEADRALTLATKD